MIKLQNLVSLLAVLYPFYLPCVLFILKVQLVFFIALSERLEQLVLPKPVHKEWQGDR